MVQPQGRRGRRDAQLTAAGGTHGGGFPQQHDAIQDRIRDWQNHGSIALPLDALSTLSAPRSDGGRSPSTSRPTTPDKSHGASVPNVKIAKTRGRDTRRLAEREREEWIRAGRASTPRKRVVSDEHWRKTKSRGEPTERKEKRSFTVQDSSGLQRDGEGTNTIRQREREERRRRRLEARAKDAARTNQGGRQQPFESDIVHAVEKESTHSLPHEDVNSNAGDRNGYGTDRDGFSDSPCEWNSQPDRDLEDILMNSKYAATLGRTQQSDQMKTKRSMLSKTKEILGFNGAESTTTNPSRTIEVWLEDQPEQPADDGASVAIPRRVTANKLPRERRKRPSQRKSQIGASPADPNKIWDAITPQPREDVIHSPESRGITHSSALQELEIPQSPVNLQRRGAKASRQRDKSQLRASSTSRPLRGDDEQQQETRKSGSLASMQAAQPSQNVNDRTKPDANEEAFAIAAHPFEAPVKGQKVADAFVPLKRTLTTHEDLMSQLSKPRSARTSRKQRHSPLLQGQSVKDGIQHILDSIKEDEVKYNRELRTLVNGVIPVLLQSMLSKHDSAATAALFTATENADGSYFTRPMIAMGVALERLKSIHARLSTNNVDRFLSWCQTAHRAYSDFVAAWRLGFQDVIVNLAPLEPGRQDDADIMERDRNGDVVNADGERVDVAYLLKRPLIRIRKLSKAISDLQAALEDHVVATKISEDYLELTAQAKRKHQQEQGRLEDEAAARIDVEKARDIRSLGPLPGASIAPDKVVRARDMFNLTLYHSTGQRMDSKIEIILRDNKPQDKPGGDILICQVDEHSKWLLFGPVDLSNVSARRAESGYDLVVMVRGMADLGTGWHELLALTAEEPEAIIDWMNMLGSKPLPPKLNRVPSFTELMTKVTPITPLDQGKITTLTSAALAKVPSLESLDIPIGEPSVLDDRIHVENAVRPEKLPGRPVPKLSLGGGLQPKLLPQRWIQQSSVPARKPIPSPAQSSVQSSVPSSVQFSVQSSVQSSIPSSIQSSDFSRWSQSATRSVSLRPKDEVSGRKAPTYGVQQQQRAPPTPIIPLHADNQPSLANSNNSRQPVSESPTSTKHVAEKAPDSHKNAKRVSIVLSDQAALDEESSVGKMATAPPLDLPILPKVRESAKRRTLSSIPLTESIREKWAIMSGRGRRNEPAFPETPSQVDTPSMVVQTDLPQPPKHKNRASMPIISNPLIDETSSPQRELDDRKSRYTTQHDARSSNRVHDPQPTNTGCLVTTPVIQPTYAPSTASNTVDEDESGYSDSSSETSEDLGSELKDDIRSLPDVMRKRASSRQPPVRHRQSAPPTTGTRTLAPSDSASQGPYRSVPSSNDYPDHKKEWVVALVCTWSDAGVWEPLRDEECSILVSPGLIEAFPPAHVQPQERSLGDPLVAFELTPIVPLRKGTALDITIRSPPTARSQIKTTNNVMFRSRTLIECDALYRLINWARCNNPTYMELQRSRPPPQPVVTFSNQQSERPKSWFSFGGLQRRSSYRAGSVPPSMPDSTASLGTVSNALTALKRFSKSSAFSINRSSVIRRPGRATNQSLYSDTNTVSGSGSSVPAPPTQLGYIPGKDGPNVPKTSAEAVNGGGMVNNMKIKLFFRQGQDWKPLGGCRLSVLPAPTTKSPEISRPSSAAGGTPELRTTESNNRRSVTLGQQSGRGYRLPSSSHTPHRIHGDGREKRVLITQKDRADVILLDEVLGESCFEKVAERGIAVKVWTEDENVRNSGGVLTGRGRVYMMQFSVQSEASWVFGLCGTYRYGMTMADH